MVKKINTDLTSGFVDAAKAAAGSGTKSNTTTSSSNTSSTNLKYGSTGDKVAEVQRALGINDDGKFGPQTQQAVKDFQAANGLEVDGIVGPKTLAALNAPKTAGNNAGDGAKDAAPETPAAEEPSTFTYEDYTAGQMETSDITNEAWNILQQHESAKPGEWSDPYRDKYMGYLEQYENRDPFSYDFNSDALYQQYKDQYIQQGQMAMMDTMGQAASMTGGYGNSYAQTVGQQAYNQQLNQLNNIMPELYQMAYDRYGQEGQEMLDMFNMYLGLSEQDYSRHQNELDNWYQEADRLTSNYNTLYDRDWNKYVMDENTNYNVYSTGRSEAYDSYQKGIDRDYQAERDKVADQQWQATFDENVRQADRSYALSASKTGTDTGKTSMPLAEQENYKKKADRAVEENGIEGLYEIGIAMENEGYSDAFIKNWIEQETERLSKTANKKTGIVDGFINSAKSIFGW